VGIGLSATVEKIRVLAHFPCCFPGGLIGEEDAAAEQVGAGASVHLPLEHLDAVDVAFD
jgi:hypothetical protein